MLPHQGLRLFFICGAIFEISSNKFVENEFSKIDLFMPGYNPRKDDDYVCTSMEVTDPGFVVEFTPTADADRTHHMLVYGCNEPALPPGETWNCEHERICNSPMKILYAWARNAPPFALPNGVGVPIGQNENVGYVVLQVHYAKKFDDHFFDYSGVRLDVAHQRPKFLAGVYLMATGGGAIPADTATYHINISCPYMGKAQVHPFAFRTHTHGLGRVVSAYKYDQSQSQWTKIGKGNPQWPQRFYPVDNPVTIFPGDVLAAQCVFSSIGRTTETSIGAHGHNEMCNFYMYYYFDAQHRDPFKPVSICVSDQRSDLFSTYPSEASTLFPANSALEETAKQGGSKIGNEYFYVHNFYKRVARGAGPNVGGGSEFGDGYGDRVGPIILNPDGVPVAVVEGGEYGQQYGQRPAYVSHVRKKPGPLIDNRLTWRSDQISSGGASIDNGQRYYYSNDFGLPNQQPDPSAQPIASSGFEASENRIWLPSGVSFGQIAGLAFDSKGNLVIFHRVDRVWNENTFDESNHFRERTSGPIMDDTILILSMAGNVVSRWGRGFFYMPHGVFMDKDGLLWTTDVALHQVFKFDTKQPAAKPLLALGTEFEPGVDERHFCKPAAVVVAGDGSIFVADGYCNNRIVKFDGNGLFIAAFGDSASEVLPNGYPKLGSFALPHHLSLHDASQRLFVADRENGRVQIFFYNGTASGQLTHPGFGTTVYAVAYCELLDTIYVLNGPSLSQSVDIRVFALDGTSRRVMYSWRPQSSAFQRPHALAASTDCATVFVGETGPKKLWRFDVNASGRRNSLKAGGKNFGDGGIHKPNMASDGDSSRSTEPQNVSQLIMILSMVLVLPILIIAAICLCIRLKKRGGFRAMNMSASYTRTKGNKRDGGRLPLLNGVFRDRNGFQRLSTEDVDAMDEISDESETEDTLYPVPQRNSTVPQKA